MDEGHRTKTIIIFHHTLQKFKRMQFGQNSVHLTISRAMDALLSLEKWQLDLVYLGNGVISSQTPSEHLTHV